MTKDKALKLALEALEFVNQTGDTQTFDMCYADKAITAIKEALAQIEQPKVRTGDCLLVGVCASEGHKIQVKQEPWRESASDYERGVVDGRQMQAQSSVDKAVNRMAHEQEPVAWEQFYPDIGKPQIAFNAEVIGYVAPQRTWVGLTEEELYEIYDESDNGSSPCGVCGACSKCKIEVAIARAIEAKLKEKNT